MFLSVGEFPERGTGRPAAAAITELTFSMSCLNCHYFQRAYQEARFLTRSFLSSPSQVTTPEELPSFHERGQAPSSLHRIRRSFRLGLIDWRYRLEAAPVGGRSRTFIGQRCQPFCSGDTTNHSIGPRAVTKYRHAKERNELLRLQPAWEHGLPTEPKRDTSRTVFTWPLRRRLLPPDPGT